MSLALVTLRSFPLLCSPLLLRPLCPLCCLRAHRETKGVLCCLFSSPALAGMASSMDASELSKYNGSDPSLPIYVSVKGRIFDVSTGRNFYGPGGSYAVFAGKDASRALGKMSVKEEDVSADIQDLTDQELTVLNDWEKKFEAKYPVVGSLAA